MRNIGTITNELLAQELSGQTRMLVKELRNAYGSVAKDLKTEILDAAIARTETFDEVEGEYISMQTLRDIVWKAGDTI